MAMIFAEALELAYPSRCSLCGRLGPCPCEACIGDMELHDSRVEFFDEGTLAFRASLYMYRGRAADAVQALKYARRTSLAGWMSDRIAQAPRDLGLEYDAVVPVPIHWSRRAA